MFFPEIFSLFQSFNGHLPVKASENESQLDYIWINAHFRTLDRKVIEIMPKVEMSTLLANIGGQTGRWNWRD